MMNRLETKAALSVDDAGEITGIAWPFGTPDRVGDMIEKGAFAGASVPIPMLAYHDPKRPIGVWTSIEESNAGLVVKGRLLVDDVADAREMRALIQAGAITGLSIGFSGAKGMHRAATKSVRAGRTIQRLDLHEISVTPVPAHPGAQIHTAKASGSTVALVGALYNAATVIRNQ
ncbi:HK97 family phage prohead protease [Aureimonas sp. AU20]|uniref:HK97 family phage prohead protease n=1 Tax=Aureimonas sp. AU20 TaxID=1349819 RepID=UPI0007228000|nr:HK97 family phage prohead protease [Aureimonas sp. AU20]ALN73588.1 hypothetical protein M673_12740 [Aureimonas sp. AU20]